jgi:hypothetical protein
MTTPTTTRTVRLGPLSVKMYCAIGMIAVSWAQLEDMVSLCISRLLGTDHTTFLPIASNMQIKARFDALKTVAGLRLPPEDAKIMIARCDEALELGRERNKILHGSWLQGESDDVAIRLNYRAHGRVSADAPMMSAREIAEISDRITMLTEGFAQILQRLGLFDPKDPMRSPGKPSDRRVTPN